MTIFQAGLLTKYGYPNEAHNVVTEDGFILTIHRIPHLQGQDPQQSRPVAFLMHGLLSSSADWVNMGPGNGLGENLSPKKNLSKNSTEKTSKPKKLYPDIPGFGLEWNSWLKISKQT